MWEHSLSALCNYDENGVPDIYQNGGTRSVDPRITDLTEEDKIESREPSRELISELERL